MANINTTLNLGSYPTKTKNTLNLGSYPTDTTWGVLGRGVNRPQQSLSNYLGANPLIPAAKNNPATPAVNYSQLENRNGTIFNKTTGQGYATPNQLAKDLGIGSNPIQWGNIAKAATPATPPPASDPPSVSQQTGVPQEYIDAWKNRPAGYTGNISGVIPYNQPVVPPPLPPPPPSPSNLPSSTPPPNYTPNTDLYGNLVAGAANTAVGVNPVASAASQSLLNKSETPSPDYKAAYNALLAKSQAPSADYLAAQAQAQEYNRKLTESRTAAANSLAAQNATDQSIEFKQGRGQIQQNQYLAQQNALAQGYVGASNLLGAANTQQGLQISGTGQAAGVANTQQQLQQGAAASAGGIAQAQQGLAQQGLISAAQLAQPQLGQPGQVPFYPISGTQGSMLGTQGGGLDINSLAQQVVGGQMTIDQANSALGGNIALTGLLRQIIAKINPNFNFAQATALGTTQGIVSPQLNMAQAAIDNLTKTFENEPWYKKFGQPVLNTLSGILSNITGLGLGDETSKQNAIKEARTQVSNALGVMTNTTPTSWTSTVESWFPDSATPDQITAGIEQFSNLAKNRQKIYGTPGSVTPYTPSAGGSGGESSGKTSSGAEYTITVK